MSPDHMVLSESEWQKAHRAILAWKNSGQGAQACPRCDAPGLALVDRSARPYSEWFELSCAACDLEVTMHIPLAPTPGAPV